jgi:ABC-type nickel/cobalt efflux system permease component RcnA
VTLASILALGFLLGMRHALDADHLAAVATLATRSPSVRRAVVQGVVWGAGHTLTLMLFGGVVLVLGGVVPERAAAALELAVGVMLVALGADVLYRLRRDRIHFHRHRHTDGAEHFHAHSHQGESVPHAQAPHDHRHARGFPARALVVGMIHGLAGSAALVLLSLETLRSPAWGLVYIAIFGFGSILGMAALSVAIAVPLRLTSHRLTRAYDGLSTAIGVATILIGGIIVYRIAAGDGLIG